MADLVCIGWVGMDSRFAPKLTSVKSYKYTKPLRFDMPMF